MGITEWSWSDFIINILENENEIFFTGNFEKGNVSRLVETASRLALTIALEEVEIIDQASSIFKQDGAPSSPPHYAMPALFVGR